MYYVSALRETPRCTENRPNTKQGWPAAPLRNRSLRQRNELSLKKGDSVSFCRFSSSYTGSSLPVPPLLKKSFQLTSQKAHFRSPVQQALAVAAAAESQFAESWAEAFTVQPARILPACSWVSVGAVCSAGSKGSECRASAQPASILMRKPLVSNKRDDAPSSLDSPAGIMGCCPASC